MSNLHLKPYAEQVIQWPSTGRHIMAQFDADSIWVYQAYRPSIAKYAVEHQRFGGDFSFARMSWIKPNFLWMMFRSGWAAKEGQEHILAVRLKRSFFDEVLVAAVPSTFDPVRYTSTDAWKSAVASSDVRLQWDPDHDPHGRCVERRAVQLGLRGDMLHRYGTQEVIEIEDITEFAIEQRQALANPSLTGLTTPVESVYNPCSKIAVTAISLGSSFLRT
jgi:Domain of unknown function (DUF4291)